MAVEKKKRQFYLRRGGGGGGGGREQKFSDALICLRSLFVNKRINK